MHKLKFTKRLLRDNLKRVKDRTKEDARGPLFQHPPFSKPQSQIRLLQIMPGDDGDDIVCELEAFHLPDAPTYEAISYVWGHHWPLKSIVVNGAVVQVRENCWYALWQRRHLQTTVTWTCIDSLCINQNDNAEKNVQVRMMGEIFGKADTVLVPLDDPDRHGACLSAHVEYLATLMNREPAIIFARAATWEKTRKWSTSVDPDTLPDLFSAIKDIQQKAYWERLWVFQELKLARGRRIMIGAYELGWEAFNMLLMLLEHTKITKEAGVHRGAMAMFKSWMTQPRNNDSSITTMISNASGDNPIGFETHVAWIARLGCTDSRDRVYGLLEAVTWNEHGDAPTVDYAKGKLQLAVEVVGIVQGGNMYADYNFAENLLNALEVSEDNEADLKVLLGNRKVRSLENTTEAANAEVGCACNIPSQFPSRVMRRVQAQGFVLSVDDREMSALVIQENSEVIDLGLCISEDRSCYFGSGSPVECHQNPNAVFGHGYKPGDLIIQVTLKTAWHSDYFPYLIVRRFSANIYEIVSHAIMRIPYSDTPREILQSCGHDFMLLLDPEDLVLFHLLCSRGALETCADDAYVKMPVLLQSLSQSFCRTRFSSFAVGMDSSSDLLDVPAICEDCGGMLHNRDK